jgi:hypothetical protein
MCTIKIFAKTCALKIKKMVFFLLKYRGHLNGKGLKNVNKQYQQSPIVLMCAQYEFCFK